MKIRISLNARLPLLIFLFARGGLLIGLFYDGLVGYADITHFFNVANMPGWPYLDFWSEFPPLFPFLSEIIYHISGATEFRYTYLLVLLTTAANLGSVFLFTRLMDRIDEKQTIWRGAIFAAILAGLPYSWWYFDSLVVFLGLLALELALSSRAAGWSGLVFGLGILTKLFPALWLPALWKWLPRRRVIILTSAALALTLLVYGSLWLASPQFTAASLQSQSAKGSWETIWALVDDNYQTGSFGPLIERLDPAAAARPTGNPPRISPWITLAAFGLIGLACFWRFHPANLGQVLSFAGFTWSLFLLWSPGWSPQWLLYLLPLILLSLSERHAVLLAALMILVNLLEWPVVFSRGFVNLLYIPILLRTVLLLLLAVLWWNRSLGREEIGRLTRQMKD